MQATAAAAIKQVPASIHQDRLASPLIIWHAPSPANTRRVPPSIAPRRTARQVIIREDDDLAEHPARPILCAAVKVPTGAAVGPLVVGIGHVWAVPVVLSAVAVSA